MSSLLKRMREDAKRPKEMPPPAAVEPEPPKRDWLEPDATLPVLFVDEDGLRWYRTSREEDGVTIWGITREDVLHVNL